MVDLDKDLSLAEVGAWLRRTLWARLCLLVAAGCLLVSPAEWVVHAVAGTQQTRAVIESAEKTWLPDADEMRCTATAVSADGRSLDLTASGGGCVVAEIPRGSPVIITRSVVDGQILSVRSPQHSADVENHAGAIVLRLACLGLAAAALWLVVRCGRPRAPVVLLTMLAGAALMLLLVTRQVDAGVSPWPAPDGMRGYPDPPTGQTAAPTGLRVDRVIPAGVPVGNDLGALITVTGLPERGLPPGADPRVGEGFTTLRVPLYAQIREGGGYLPNMKLIGTGAGWATSLDSTPACGGSPDGFPQRFTEDRRGFACFAVPDGFVPRYLVFFNDSVAVDLQRSTGR